ncbi:MAG: UDP-N-acetylmuramyl-tripeptide synthetase [Planctomycetia bacterium]|nr:UDP-N-acetylmuramyl-tripeptide synthetase [Planctomycetia bacterium]
MDGGPVGKLSVSLKELLPHAEIVGAGDIVVTHCTADSRSCREGDLFVAIAGTQANGHNFAAQAIALGAKAIVASRPIADAIVPVCYVADTAAAYGLICQALAGNPSRNLKTIGVAGSFGKTTTGYLIGSVLNASGITTGMLGSLGYCDGREISDARWTTPPQHVAAAWLARMVDNGCTHAVAELSGRGLRQSHMAGVAFDALCVTNLRSEHEDSSSAECRTMTSRMLEHLTPEGLLVVNVDDPGAAALAERHAGPMLTVGMNLAAEISANVVERHRSEQTFLLSFGREVVPVRTPLIGDHNVANCLLAAAIGTAYGIAPTKIVRGLEEVRELPGRLERIECGQNYSVFVDEGLSPESLATCLTALRTASTGRVICVFNSTADHSRLLRTRLARTVEQACDLAIITESPTGGVESPSELANGFRDANKRSIVADRTDAIREALKQAQPGDSVLIAGQGAATYSIADREQDYWDDRQVVRQYLYQLTHDESRADNAA